ncbi:MULTISPECIES: outer membrane protein transport protein [Rodentibacter]|uniref:outer membrane protein transport protein n=1 Tax=Rodentibacter TaxID=1960084 RepID=UPI001CFF28D1|nr:outer membrane protein transport protein [Rodentibacter sp. JRC1]GJI56430.1 outer membrane protein P1 [Rodentibacter sp. JRC1]
MKKFNQSLLAVAMLLTAGGANAAAFQLSEVSTSGLGRAYAGEAAMADNASVVATNPALMSMFKTNQFSVGGVYVDSKINMSGPVTVSAFGRTLAQGSASQKSVVPGSFIPNMYFVAPINDKFAVGAGMNVNFGLKSEYDNNYDAGVFGGKTDLTAINLNLSGSYRVTQGLSAGVGLNAVYAKAEIERRAGILSTAVKNAAPLVPSLVAAGRISPNAAQSLSRLQGMGKDTVLTHLRDRNAWGFGWNAGLLYEFNERNRIGVAYHSKIDIDFNDRYAVSAPRAIAGAPAGEGNLTLHLPDYLEVSGFHRLTDRFAMHYSYKYTHWSRLKSLHATYNTGELAFHKDENYRSNSRIALGATYDVNDQLTLRAGIAYDEAAATLNHASASIPDTDRTWYSFGATYKVTPNLSVDLGYAYLKGKKIQFKESQDVRGIAKIEADYTSKASASLYGLNLNYSF